MRRFDLNKKITVVLGFIHDLELKSKIYLIMMFILSLAQGIFPVLNVLLVSMLVSKIIYFDTTVIIFLLFTILTVKFVEVIISSLYSYISELSLKKIGKNIQYKFIDKMENVSLESYDDVYFQQLLFMASTNIESSVIIIVEQCFTVLAKICSLIGFAFSIIIINVYSVIILLIFSSISYYFKDKSNKLAKISAQKVSDKQRKLIYYKQLFSEKSKFRELKLFSLFEYFKNKLSSYYDEVTEIQMKFKYKDIQYTFLSKIFSYIGIIVSLLLIIFYSSNVNYLKNNFYLLYSSIMSLSMGLDSILVVTSVMSRSLFYLEKFNEFLNYKAGFSELPCKMENVINDIKTIEIKNLNFTYPYGQTKILKNINMNLEKGDIVLVVGENGSGKTTLMNILLNLYDAKDDCLYINGNSIKDIDKNSYRQLTSCIFQDYGKFSDTVRYNVAMSNIIELDNDEMISDSLIKANIKDYSSRLDSELTKMFNTTGIEPSGGQWQKIALARAIFSKKQLLIMDEPTASLDSASELDFYEKIKENSDERITIIVSHRLSVAKLANKIIYIDDGTILEEGNIQDVMKLKGHFYKLYNEQKSMY